MVQINESVIKKILTFEQKDWQDWIWERTHGWDTYTALLEPGDPYPQQLLQDVYDQILIQDEIEAKNKFIKALKFSINHSLEECQRYLKVDPENPNLASEWLALERHFHVINHFPDTELERIKDDGLQQVCKQCYDFIFRNSSFFDDDYGSLKRVVLQVCFRLNRQFVPLDDLKHELGSTETFVVAFRCLCEKDGLEAIGKYFPDFVSTSFQAGQKVLTKLELKHIKRSYYIKCPQQIEYQLRIALNRIQERSEVQYTFVKQKIQEFDLELERLEPVKIILTQVSESLPPNKARAFIEDLFLKNGNSYQFAGELLIYLCKDQLESDKYLKYIDRFVKLEAMYPKYYNLEYIFFKINIELAPTLFLSLCKNCPEQYPRYVNSFSKLEAKYAKEKLKSTFNNFTNVVSLSTIAERFEKVEVSVWKQFLWLLCGYLSSPTQLIIDSVYIGLVPKSGNSDDFFPLLSPDSKYFGQLVDIACHIMNDIMRQNGGYLENIKQLTYDASAA